MLVILNIGNPWDTFEKTNWLCFLKLLLGNDSIKNYQRLFKGLYNHFYFKYWVFYSNPLDCWKIHFQRRKCWKYIIHWSVFLLYNVLGIKLWQLEWNFSFNCYLAVPQPTLGHSQEDSLTNPMLITVFVQVWPKGHQESCNQVGSLSPAESLADFEPGTFQFWKNHWSSKNLCNQLNTTKAIGLRLWFCLM